MSKRPTRSPRRIIKKLFNVDRPPVPPEFPPGPWPPRPEIKPLPAKLILVPVTDFKRATTVVRFFSGVDAIVQEIIDMMTLAVGLFGKTFTPTALDEWKPKLWVAVFDMLYNKQGDWPSDRPNVLTVAFDMGLIAALLSGNQAQVNKGRLHAAFRAVKAHDICPGNLGAGFWCDFNI